MKIKDFVKGYESRPIQTKDSYIKDSIKVEKYLSFIKKNALMDKLVAVSTFKFEDYTKPDGSIGRRKTNIIKMDSVTQYLLFCRLVIENYTDLEIESGDFFEEYDLLKQSGLLDRLIVSTEQMESIIPASEIAELRGLFDMKQKDEIFNATEIHNYISSQIERIGEISDIFLPMLEKAMQASNNEKNCANEETDFLEIEN